MTFFFKNRIKSTFLPLQCCYTTSTTTNVGYAIHRVHIRMATLPFDSHHLVGYAIHRVHTRMATPPSYSHHLVGYAIHRVHTRMAPPKKKSCLRSPFQIIHSKSWGIATSFMPAPSIKSTIVCRTLPSDKSAFILRNALKTDVLL